MDEQLELLVDVLRAVKESAENGNALALGPGAVHNLWTAIASLQQHQCGGVEQLAQQRNSAMDDVDRLQGLLKRALDLLVTGWADPDQHDDASAIVWRDDCDKLMAEAGYGIPPDSAEDSR